MRDGNCSSSFRPNFGQTNHSLCSTRLQRNEPDALSVLNKLFAPFPNSCARMMSVSMCCDRVNVPYFGRQLQGNCVYSNWLYYTYTPF